MRLLSVVKSECLAPGLTLETKEQALAEVVKAAKLSKVIADVDSKRLLKGLKAREELGSTGFGHGIAIPHCRLPEARDFVVGILTAPMGVAFDSVDGKDVKVIVFIIGPERESNEHISLLSEVSHALMIPGAVEEMIAAPTPEALRESFVRHSRDNVDTRDHASKNLFHVFVADERKFREILQVFAALEATALSVVEARTASEYLAKIPLFAGFWSDRTADVCHAITALVEKRFTNEIIRRIELVSGKLDESTDVVITVQNVFYAAGLLGV